MIDVFQVGVRMSFASNGPEMMALLLRNLGMVHTSVEQLKTRFDELKPIIAGAMTAFAGVEVLRGITRVIEASRELNKELERTKQLGGDFAGTVDQARAAAFRGNTGALPTFAPDQLVRLRREIGTQLGRADVPDAVLNDAGKVAEMVHQATGEDKEEVIKNLIRVADARGAIFSKGSDGKEYVDEAKLLAELNAAGAGLIFGQGYINSQDLRTLTRQGELPAKLMDARVFYAQNVEAAIEMGAARLGTAETSLLQQFLGGKMTKQTAQEMQKFGLLKADEWHTGRGGAITMDQSATDRFKALAENPFQFIAGPLQQALKEHGVQGMDALIEVFRLFGRQTSQRLAALIMQNDPQFVRAGGIFANIPAPTQQFDAQMQTNLTMNLEAFNAAWKGFMEALGDKGVPLAIDILHKLTDGLHVMTDFVEKHPALTSALLDIAGGLGAIAAVAGITTLGLALTNLAGVASAGTGIAGLGAAAAAALGPITALIGAVTLGKALSDYAKSKDAEYAKDPSKMPGALKTLEGFRLWLHHQFGDDNAEMYPGEKDAIKKQSYAAPAGGSGPTIVNASIMLDKTKLGNAMIALAGDKLLKADPATGNSFDLPAGPLYSGLNYARI